MTRYQPLRWYVTWDMDGQRVNSTTPYPRYSIPFGQNVSPWYNKLSCSPILPTVKHMKRFLGPLIIYFCKGVISRVWDSPDPLSAIDSWTEPELIYYRGIRYWCLLISKSRFLWRWILQFNINKHTFESFGDWWFLTWWGKPTYNECLSKNSTNLPTATSRV